VGSGGGNTNSGVRIGLDSFGELSGLGRRDTNTRKGKENNDCGFNDLAVEVGFQDWQMSPTKDGDALGSRWVFLHDINNNDTNCFVDSFSSENDQRYYPTKGEN